MAKIDIEEKFKKDISKEVANLKEFLISQGKEIVKLKQENKAIRETSVGSSGSVADAGKSMPAEVKALLEKHTIDLEKQKANTTKLSKLCLGTLNELEKFEKKQERETSAAPKTEDRIKRLTDENKKLIHLVTTLDQQMALMEGKLNKNIFDSEELAKRVRHSSVDRAGKQAGGVGELTREEVFRIVRENVPAAAAPAVGSEVSREEVVRIVRENIQQSEENNQEKNAQIQSLITEVQNIIGQIRELGMQFRELTEKVRKIEGNDTNERFGVELAGALSRIEKIERDGTAGLKNQPKQANTAGPDISSKRIEKIELDLKRVDKLETSVGAIEKLGVELKSNKTVATEAKDQVKKIEQDLSTTIKTIGTVKVAMDEALRKIEADEKVSRDAERSIALLENELAKTTTMAKTAKTSVDDVVRKVDRMQKEEDAARAIRKDQNTFSVEDIKKDFIKVQEQSNYLEEKIVTIQKLADSTGIESKNKCNKLSGEIELIAEKVKSMSLGMKEEKYKTDEKIIKIENQSDNISKFKDDIEKKISTISTSQAKIQKVATSAEEMSKLLANDIQSFKSELSSNKTNTDKCAKNIEENNTKIFDCVHDFESLKDSIEKLKKNIDRRPAAEDIDKKSELSNKLYNDLSAKIDDVDVNLKKEVKKTRSDIEKCNKDMKNIQSKCDEVESASTKDIKSIKDELTVIKTSSADLKNCSKDISALKSDCDKNSKDLKNITTKVDDAKKELSTIKLENGSVSTKIEKLQAMEKDLEVMKKEKPLDKFTSIEKDISSLRADHEKLNKDVKGLSTEVKYVDSTLKKESTNTKTEIGSFTKTIKGFEKDLNTIHNMIDVLNNEKGSAANSEDVSKVKAELTKVSTEIKEKSKSLEDSLTKKINGDIKDLDTKVKSLEKKIDSNSKGIDAIEVDKKIKTAKDDINLSIDGKIKTAKDEVTSKVTTASNDLKALEKKVDENNKPKGNTVEIKDIDNKIKLAKDDITSSIDTKVQKCKDELTTKITLSETKVQKIKEELTSSITKCSGDQKTFEKKLETTTADLKKFADMQTKLTKQEEGIAKMQKTVDNLDISNRANKSGDELKKEVDKINQQIKDSIKSVEVKISSQETQVKTLDGKVTKQDSTISDLKTKIDKLPKQEPTASKPDDSLKKDVEKINQTVTDKIDKLTTQIKGSEKTLTDKITNQEKSLTDKINQQVKDSQKTLQDKITAQDRTVKDATEKIAKLEKGDSSASKSGGETAKLVTLTKAIDAIQENSKSLETMVKKMKTEFSTPKDLEKLRVELSGKMGGGIDPNHPDMGPIMDSLIMTNDRPYIDCSTITPMTGNGLVKFERFVALNKLPWDDVNDQFVIQEPGVYAVFVTAILQDAVLSVKIASNMLEREIFNVGSREGLVGCSAPTFVSRGGLLQIDDDENVADTILVEIHADNEESFVDKNVTLTMYKIGESPGGE